MRVYTAAVRLTNMKLSKSFTPVSRVISIVFNFDQIMERLTLMKRTNKKFSVHRAINDKIQPIDMPLIVLSVVLYDTIIHVHLLYSTITLSIKSNQVAV